MMVVEVTIRSIRDTETASAAIIQEQKRGDTFNRVKVTDVTSGTPEATVRKILLADDERLVIEGRADTKVVFDKEQNAAVPVPTDPKKAQEKVVEDAVIKERNIAAEEMRRQGDDEEKIKKELDTPKTNLGRPVPPATTVPPVVPPKPVVPPAPPRPVTAPAATVPPKPPVPAPNPPVNPAATGSMGNHQPTVPPNNASLNSDTGQGARDSNDVKINNEAKT